MFGLIAAALALTCLCLHAVQRGATDDENGLKYKYSSDNDDDAEFTLTVYFMKRKNCAICLSDSAKLNVEKLANMAF